MKAGIVLALVAFLAFLLVACTPPQGPARCSSLRSRHRAWSAVSYGSAALSGGGAITAAMPDDEDTRLAVGIGSAVVAVLTAAAVYLRGDYAAEIAASCQKVP